MEIPRTKQSPQVALKSLREGNRRFLANLRANRDLQKEVAMTAQGQSPTAVILSCIDSRISTEIIFDQGLGDIFSIRVAGNVLNHDVLGSMEFACALAGAQLIVIMGHSSCGAIRGACDRVELEHLSGLLLRIKPLVERVEKGAPLSSAELIQRVSELNVEHVIEEIQRRSQTLSAMIAKGRLGIVGAMYSVATGTVEFQNMQMGDGAGF